MNAWTVNEFYANRCVFITGATGFLGKVLLEKLLRSCSDVERIYILIRPKQNEDVTARLRKLLNCSIFTRLHSTKPEVFEKVIGICGDVLNPSLGISLADRELLINDVSVVFHVAASIRFNETLKFATDLNVTGTIRVVDLCKQMRKLKCMVYVSTAYSNCDREEIKEEIYPVNMEPHRLLSLAEWMEENVLESISPKLVGKKITTYHMTKSIAEKILEKESENISIIIVRPSVVVGAWQEPLRGWTETLYHINGILVAAGRGVLRVLLCNPDSIVDIVPVDLVTNLLIVSASEMSPREKSGLKLFNFVSGVDNPLTYRQLRDYALPALRNNPFLYPVWYPYFSLVKYKVIAWFMMLFLHWLPALVVDNAIRLFGMPPRLGKVARRIETSQSMSQHFLLNDFKFCNKNVKALWKNLSAEDQKEFCFDITKLSWKHYLEGYILGCKQFVVKEDLSTLPRARCQMKTMKYLYHFLYWLMLIPIVCWLVPSFG